MSGYMELYGRGALSIACPKCGSEPGKSCRALTSGRSTDTHTARIDAYWSRPNR